MMSLAANPPMVSVIIPVYNQEKFIDNCIESLKKQTIGFDSIQMLLINDGSSDESLSICQKLANQYDNVVLLNQENKGVSAARNAGIKRADGKYLFFLDLSYFRIYNEATNFDIL